MVEIVEIVETVNQQVPGRRRSSGLSFQKANLVRVGLRVRVRERLGVSLRLGLGRGLG